MNLKKIIRKDSNGNSMSFEFDVPKANVPPVDSIPNYDHPGEPRGSDTVPAWLTPGENIVNAEASRLPGNQQIIDHMNNQGRAIQAQQGGSIPTYADGGGLIDIARTATEYAPYMLAGINSIALPAGLWGLYKSNRDGKRRAAMKSEGGPVYADSGMEVGPDTSWVEDILDSLKFVESGNLSEDEMISPAGAEGYYQIMPSNFGLLADYDKEGNVIKTYEGKGAAGYGTPVITKEEAYDEAKARNWAKTYLTNMQLAHPDWSPTEVLRAYNWGPGNVQKYMKGEISFDEMPEEAQKYVGKVFKHYEKLNKSQFPLSGTDAPGPSLNVDEVPITESDNGIPAVDLVPHPEQLDTSMLTNPNFPVDSSVEIDVDGPGQNFPSGPGGVPNMPMNFMGSANPRRGYESGQDYMNTFGLIDPSSRQVSKIYDGAPSVPGMDALYQTYPKDITPDYYPTQEQLIKGPGVPPQAVVDPTSRMEREVENNIASANKEFSLTPMLNQMDDYSDPYGEFGEPPALTPVTQDYAPIPSLEEPEIEKPAEEFDYRAAQLRHIQDTHDLKNRDVWEDDNIEKILESEYVAGHIGTEAEFVEKLNKAREIKQNKDNKVLNHWDRKDNNAKKQAVVETEAEVLELFQKLERTTNPKLREALEKEIDKKKTEIKELHKSIVKGVDESGWSTDTKKSYTDPFQASFALELKNRKINEKENNLKSDTEKRESIISSIQNAADLEGEQVTESVEEVENAAKSGGRSGYESGGDKTNTKLAKDPPSKEENKVFGFLKSFLGDLWDTKELKRAAVMYLGSRILGYGHGTSLNYSLKNMVGRIDQKVANREAFVTNPNIIKQFTAGSLQKYRESGNLGDLISKGVPLERTGNTKLFYKNVNGKTVEVKGEEVKQGDNTFYIDRGGNRIDQFTHDGDPRFVEGTDEWKQTIKDNRTHYTNMLKGMIKSTGEDSTGKAMYPTDIVPAVEADRIIKWALDRGIDIDEIGKIMELAYGAAVEDSYGREERITDLVPYLESMIIRQQTQHSNKFNLENGKPIDTKKFYKLQENVSTVMRYAGFKGSDQNLFNQYINQAVVKWDALSDADRKQWNRKASDGVNGFYVMISEDILGTMNNIGG